MELRVLAQYHVSTKRRARLYTSHCFGATEGMASGTSEQNNVSIIALIISLIALVIAFGQLLQQLFGTADRYRRANEQVIGPFAQTRKRLFHFTELRLETVLSTPHIKFRPSQMRQMNLVNNDMTMLYDPDYSLDAILYGWIRRSHTSTVKTLLGHKKKPLVRGHAQANPRNQALAAGWLVLLDQIWLHQKIFADRSYFAIGSMSSREHQQQPARTTTKVSQCYRPHR